MTRIDHRFTRTFKALVLAIIFGFAALAIAERPATAEARGGCAAKSNGTNVGEKLVGTQQSDCLRGGGGRDRIDARAGADTLLARDGSRDLVKCGSGDDIALVDPKDRVSNCEEVRGGKSGAGSGFDGSGGGAGGAGGSNGTGSDPAGASTPAPAQAGPCAVPLAGLAQCELLFDDPGTALDPSALWGVTDCEDDLRHTVLPGGDPTAAVAGATDDSYRRLTVLDGDDVWGERCELGLNNHVRGPTTLYREGQRRLTSFSLRLADNFPLSTESSQVVMQMKQTQPSANGGGTPVISLSARRGQWQLHRSSSVGPSSGSEQLWTAPAQTGHWARFSFDVNYSQDPSLGSIKVYVDLNGDGDSADPGEQSPTIQTYTLKRETEGGVATDGIAPGESIPAHLRIGPYHDASIACPPPVGCGMDLDNVQVVDPS